MALDKKLQEKLKKAQKAWKGADKRVKSGEGGGGFEEFEDGRYLARPVAHEIGESKSSNRVQLKTEWKFVEGPYKGKIKYAYDGMETEDNLIYIQRNIGRFGYESPEDILGVDAVMTEICKEKPLCRIRLKTKGDFQNVYIDEVFGKDDEEEAIADASSESADADEPEAESDDEATEDTAEEDAAEEEPAEEEAEAETEADDDDEQVALEVGMAVGATFKGEKVVGEVIEILEKEEQVRIKTEAGKVIRVGIDKLEPVDDGEAEDEETEEVEETEEDSEEDVPEAPPVRGKKPAPAPAKKPVPAPAPAKTAVKKKK